MKIAATIITDSIVDSKIPGAIKYWSYNSRPDYYYGFNFKCPCGCGALGSVKFARSNRPGWSFDGNKERPTVSPSISFTKSDGQGGQVSHWHGWLRNGEWST